MKITLGTYNIKAETLEGQTVTKNRATFVTNILVNIGVGTRFIKYRPLQ
jgi:hypothetical protein